MNMIVKKPCYSKRYRTFILCCLIATGGVLAAVLSGCATLTEQEKHTKTAAIDLFARQTIDKIIRENRELNKEFESAAGYAILSLDTAKIPYVGYGGGKGVLVEKTNGQRSYLKIKIQALGSGLGAKSFRFVLLFDNEAAVKRFKSGMIKFGAGADVAANGGEAEGVRLEGKKTSHKDFSVYAFNDAGVSATLTAWMIRVSLDKDLN